MHSRRLHWYQRIAHSQHRPDNGPRWAASLLAWARQAECTATVPHHRSYAPENLKLALLLRPAYAHLAEITSTPWSLSSTAQLPTLNGPGVPQT